MNASIPYTKASAGATSRACPESVKEIRPTAAAREPTKTTARTTRPKRITRDLRSPRTALLLMPKPLSPSRGKALPAGESPGFGPLPSHHRIGVNPHRSDEEEDAGREPPSGCGRRSSECSKDRDARVTSHGQCEDDHDKKPGSPLLVERTKHTETSISSCLAKPLRPRLT